MTSTEHKYEIHTTTRFDKAYDRLSVTSRALVIKIINTLASGKSLALKYRDHKLKGDFAQCRECHIKPDLLLIYAINKRELILTALDIGTHSKLFSL